MDLPENWTAEGRKWAGDVLTQRKIKSWLIKNKGKNPNKQIKRNEIRSALFTHNHRMTMMLLKTMEKLERFCDEMKYSIVSREKNELQTFESDCLMISPINQWPSIFYYDEKLFRNSIKGTVIFIFKTFSDSHQISKIS